MQLYLRSEGRQSGPFSFEQLHAMAVSGEVSPTDLGWYDGCINWVPLGNIPGLFESVATVEKVETPDADTPSPPAIPPAPSAPPIPSRSLAWTRFAARFIDLILFSLLLGVFLDLFVSAEQLQQMGHWLGIFTLLAYCLVEPFLLQSGGTTPGKWLLNLKVQTLDSQSPSLPQAFRRTLLLWAFGLGMGLPIFSIATMLLAYFRLRTTGILYWDLNAGTRVIHAPLTPWRIVLATVLLTSAFLLALLTMQTASG